MIKAILKIASLVLFSVLVIVSLFMLIRDFNNPRFSFLKAGQSIKQQRLSNTNSPRIILCGGSNLAFGIDSKLIEDKTGLSIVNMGLQRGLGLPYMLKELKGKIKETDIVILCLEYDFYYDKQLDGYTPLFMLENKLNNFHYFNNHDDLLRIITFTPKFLQIKMNSIFFNTNTIKNPVYNKDAFNEYGDVISHMDVKQKPQNLNYNVFDLDYNTKSIRLINDFVSENPQAKIYTVFPSFIESVYNKKQKKIEKLNAFISTRLNTTFIGEPNTFVFPDQYFFDSVYHLNKEGRKMRSEKLAELINSIIYQ